MNLEVDFLAFDRALGGSFPAHMDPPRNDHLLREATLYLETV
jgi:hypothetical protein